MENWPIYLKSLTLDPKILLKMVQKPGDFLELWKVCGSSVLLAVDSYVLCGCGWWEQCQDQQLPPLLPATSRTLSRHCCTLHSGDSTHHSKWTQLPHSLDTHTHWLHTPTTTLHPDTAHCTVTLCPYRAHCYAKVSSPDCTLYMVLSILNWAALCSVD